MRTRVQIDASIVRDRRATLVAACPEAIDHLGYLHADFDESDSRTRLILSWLEAQGLSKWAKRGPIRDGMEYAVTRIREYGADDLASAEYLEPRDEATECVDVLGPSEDGWTQIGEQDLVRERDFEPSMTGNLIVPQRTREAIEAAGLIGAAFAPIDLLPGEGAEVGSATYDHPRKGQKPRGGPWWELTSGLILPPVSPTMNLLDRKGNPLPPGDPDARYYAKDGDYNHAELRFRRSDLVGLPAFDVARTIETFGILPRLVLSQRFSRAMLGHGLKGFWVPVHVEG